MSAVITAAQIAELTDDWLSPTLVAYVSGARSRDVIAFWCTDFGEPDPCEARRLAFALDILKKVAAAEQSRDVALAWFMGANVGEDLISPREGIRTDQFEAVEQSAQRLIDDVPFSA